MVASVSPMFDPCRMTLGCRPQREFVGEVLWEVSNTLFGHFACSTMMMIWLATWCMRWCWCKGWDFSRKSSHLYQFASRSDYHAERHLGKTMTRLKPWWCLLRSELTILHLLNNQPMIFRSWGIVIPTSASVTDSHLFWAFMFLKPPVPYSLPPACCGCLNFRRQPLCSLLNSFQPPDTAPNQPK